LVAAVILSAVVPTMIAQKYFFPAIELEEDAPDERENEPVAEAD